MVEGTVIVRGKDRTDVQNVTYDMHEIIVLLKGNSADDVINMIISQCVVTKTVYRK